MQLSFWNNLKKWSSKYLRIYSKFFFQKKWIEAFIVTFVAVCLILGVFIIIKPLTYDNPDFKQNWDHHVYIAMATTPLQPYRAPHAYYILEPSIVHFMPTDTQTSFRILTFLCLAGTAIVIYYLMRRLQFGRNYAFGGMLLYASTVWAIQLTVYDFWLPDPLSFFFIVLIIYLILGKHSMQNAILLALCFGIGVIAKETILFCIPLCYTYRAKTWFDKKVLLITVLVSLPGFISYALIHMYVPTTGNYSIFSLFIDIGWKSRILGFTVDDIKFYTFYPFGIILLALPMFSPQKNIRFLLKSSPFLLLVYSQVMISLFSNAERLIVLAFPVLIIASLYGLESLTSKLKINKGYAIIIPTAAYLVQFFKPPVWDSLLLYLTLQGLVLIIGTAILFWIGEGEEKKRNVIAIKSDTKKRVLIVKVKNNEKGQ